MTGDTYREAFQVTTLRERFDAQWTPEPNTGCWLWAGAGGGNGYGSFSVGGKSAGAHRFAWELYRGPIPDGMVIDHMCRVRCCVNPAHLRVVTPVQNILENSVGFSAINAQKTHCVWGHELTPANTRTARGWRECLTCRALDTRKQNSRRRIAGTGPFALAPRQQHVPSTSEEEFDEDEATMRCGHKGRSWSSEWRACMECKGFGVPSTTKEAGHAEQ